MEHFHLALTFSEWALEFLIVPPVCFVSVPAAVSLVFAGKKQRPFQTHLWKPYHWLALTHLLFFAMAIFVGVHWVSPVNHSLIPHHADRSATLWLDAVVYGSLASCAFWIWRMKGFRWYAASLMVLAELNTLGALFIAHMTISGAWI